MRIEGLIIFVKNSKAGHKNIKIKINSVASNFTTTEVAYMT